ncbi:hypothetical protein H9Q72_001566 [Fusarium xylarioides]|uniref:Pal1 cell morphology protein n=1 Tax=Fusarium xylarioides TaxID=221167 RepID=A0A9P7I816_9HYPO|nr:hypothetical protein H9Q70_002123 [Fusarium xylarioides]KAG5772160.1 hypothetical protein H9Q72_001566 [Fusarium xylarioides]KAG5784663.1 hypothetical protein H9Q73_001727 [Fusarium xylarioides]
MKDSSDKQWAKAYILDPLNDIEPNQDTGIGASHNLAAQFRNISLEGSSSNSNSNSKRDRTSHSSQRHRQGSYPTPPTSASPTRDSFHSSNPFSDAAAARRQSSAPSVTVSPPDSPPGPSDTRRDPFTSSVNRSASARVPPPRNRPQVSHNRSFSASNCGVSRERSLIQRYPGDMSHRPLDILRKEARAADRAPHLRRKQMPMTDTIDALDTIGGMYHHGGPYDATLASRNRNKKYSPVAAVEDSNQEALRATPRENIQDALLRKMPLQGTADIPSGQRDISGNTIDYEEGADLMREPDAVGGAYKRWDGIQYHPDDLKGKGEPSYTYEKDLKQQKRFRRGEPVEYELSSNMRGSKRPPFSHNRSFSENPRTTPEFSNGTDIRRNNSTGKHRLSDGIRRRFGSMRRKKVEVE